MKPQRIQLRRTKGWKMPPGAIYVGRPSKWGNPFPLEGDWITWTAVALGYRGDAAGRRAAAIALHRAWLLSEPVALGPLAGDTHGGVLRFENGGVVSVGTFAQNLAAAMAMQSDAPTLSAPPTRDEIRGALGGKRVCCWCRENEPCHGDTLCEVANA